MIKAYKDENALGGVKVVIEGEASDILQEFAHIGTEIYNAAFAAMGKIGDTEYDEADEYYDLEPGDHFYYNYFAITADIADDLQFNDKGGDGSNNWARSELRRYLNNEYIDHMKINTKHLVKTRSDLTADNGDTKYGTCEDFVTLLSCDQYRKYRALVPRYSDYVWTLTPWSCDVGGANTVRYVYPSGALRSYTATNSFGVAPACTFNHEILIARRQARDGRIVLDEATGSDGED
jgi:hypothetical protein